MIEESTHLSNVEYDEGTSSDGKNHLNEERNAVRILCDVRKSRQERLKLKLKLYQSRPLIRLRTLEDDCQ